MMAVAPTIIVFDSGLGGLTVYGELRRALPRARYLYVADNAAFPYGNLQEDELVTRLLALFEVLIKREKPDICVIACNTASTIALAPLRDHFKTPFVGVVPAIKTAAETTRSGLFSVLATPGTVRRDYTKDLIRHYAHECDVTLVGARDLATLAEQTMSGSAIDTAKLLTEISPAFVEKEGRRTDIVVLGCTHYPLLVEEMRKLAPWPVSYIDPAPAVARQTVAVLSRLSKGGGAGAGSRGNRLIHTGEENIADGITGYLQGIGLSDIRHDQILG